VSGLIQDFDVLRFHSECRRAGGASSGLGNPFAISSHTLTTPLTLNGLIVGVNYPALEDLS
ncbi:MAG TPA: hypothetical protein VH107_15350, partial [Lacipirellulaceae bacterium]|nr:hypothetical protein [Lacipirellulaceae bacterium]